MTAAVIDRRRISGTTTPSVAPRSAPARRARRAQRRRVFLMRRLLVALVLGVMVVAIASVLALRSEAASDPGVVAAAVVVGEGETVWDIAREYVPAGVHPQAYVAAVLRHNDVDPTAVVPGTVLELPR